MVQNLEGVQKLLKMLQNRKLIRIIKALHLLFNQGFTFFCIWYETLIMIMCGQNMLYMVSNYQNYQNRLKTVHLVHLTKTVVYGMTYAIVRVNFFNIWHESWRFTQKNNIWYKTIKNDLNRLNMVFQYLSIIQLLSKFYLATIQLLIQLPSSYYIATIQLLSSYYLATIQLLSTLYLPYSYYLATIQLQSIYYIVIIQLPYS